jgi:hypothetical protein
MIPGWSFHYNIDKVKNQKVICISKNLTKQRANLNENNSEKANFCSNRITFTEIYIYIEMNHAGIEYIILKLILIERVF